MNKILVFSYQRSSNYRYADVNFYNEIKKKIPADFAAASYKMQNEQSFETYPKKFENNVKFKNANTLWIDSYFQAAKLFLKYDVVILCGLFGSKIFSDFAIKLGLRVILVDQSFNYDYFINEKVDLVILRNIYGLKRFKKLNKKFKGKIKIASSIDAGEINFPLYKQVKHKNALIVLSGSQHHDEWYKKRIKKIETILLKNNFKIFYKNHPRSFLKKKDSSHIPDNQNKLNLILNKTQIVVSMHSNFYQELNYFNYPVVFIDRLLFLSPENLRDKIRINNFSFKIKIYTFAKDRKFLKKINDLKPKKDLSRINMYKSKLNNGFKFYGCDISSDYFDKFLKKKTYFGVKISKIKLKKYKKELINQSGQRGIQEIINEVEKNLNHWKKISHKGKTSFEKKIKFFNIFFRKSITKFNIFK